MGKHNYRGFRDLIVYQLSYKLAFEIYEISKEFPKEERYSLTDQIRRSSRSIPSNIAALWNKMTLYYVYILIDWEKVETKRRSEWETKWWGERETKWQGDGRIWDVETERHRDVETERLRDVETERQSEKEPKRERENKTNKKLIWRLDHIKNLMFIN